MNSLIKRYFTDSVFLNLPSVVTFVLVLVTLPIVLKSLPVADYGKWQFVTAIQAWMLVFSAGHITMGSKRGIARGQTGTFIFAFLARWKFLIPIGLFVIAGGATLYYLHHVVLAVLTVIMGLYLFWGYPFQSTFFEFLIAKKRFKTWALWQVVISLVAMIGSTLTAYYTKNVFCFVGFQLGSSGLISLFLWSWLVKKYHLLASYKKGEIDRNCLSYGIKLIPIDLIAVTAGSLSHFLIGPLMGFASLAVFSIASKLRNKVATVLKSTRALLYADFAKKQSKDVVKKLTQRSTVLLVAMLSIVITVGAIASVWLYVSLFLPKQFQPVILYFSILALALPGVLLTIIMHTLLESHLRNKEIAIAGIFSNILRILLILVLGYLWHIIGICVALVLTTWVAVGIYYALTINKDILKGILYKHSLLDKWLGI